MTNPYSLSLNNRFSFPPFFNFTSRTRKRDFPLPNIQATETIAEGRAYARGEIDRLATLLGETVEENLIFVYTHSPLRDAYNQLLERQRTSFHAEKTPFFSLLILYMIFFAFSIIGVFGYVHHANDKMIVTTFSLACLPLIVAYLMRLSVKTRECNV